MDGTAAETGWIGRAMPRREDGRLLRGQGRFVADLAPPGCLHLAFVRSPFAAGRITALDTAAAAAMPGVVLVLTAADLRLHAQAAVNPLIPADAVLPMVPLAQGRVAAVGQAVAAVVAGTAAEARDAAEAVGLAVAEDAPAPARPVVDHGRAAGALPEGPAVAARVDHALVAPMALEPRAVLADRDGSRLTLHTGVQTPHRARDDLAAMLGLPAAAVRVIAPDVGGAFGGKASLMPEDVVVAAAALRLSRPVLWVAARGEEFLAATQGRGAATAGQLILAPDGRAAGLAATVDFPLGHWMAHSALAPVNNAARIPPGPYAIPAVAVRATARPTGGAGVNIYRGAGRPEAAMLIERLMDRAAAATGADPLDYRRAHLAPPAGSGPGSAGLAALAQAIAPAWAAAKGWRAPRRAAGAVAGAGLALYAEPCGQGWEHAEVALTPEGIVARTGATAQGQGRETAAAQIVAAALSVAPAQVRVETGDTGRVAAGIGALASRSTAIGGSALWLAARRLAALAREAAALRLNCAPDAVRLTPAGAAGPAGRIGWAALAPLAAAERYTAPAEAWAAGAVVARVALDPETGAVTVARIDWADDAGCVVNPMLVEGQMIGGAAQGLGAALMERIVYDGGQLLTGSLMDYAIPRAADMPPFALLACPTPTTANALGARGVGEAGTIGVPAAILNAVMDALPPGTPDLPLPLTPERVWRALHGMDPC